MDYGSGALRACRKSLIKLASLSSRKFELPAETVADAQLLSDVIADIRQRIAEQNLTPASEAWTDPQEKGRKDL